jgi:hypothetical protein
MTPTVPDELDRLFLRLVQIVRERMGSDVSAPMEILELYQDIIPYRVFRRERGSGFDTNEDYEHALTRLLSGERGYVRGDERMQQTLRDELGARNPDTAFFREFARNHVAVTAEGMAAAESLVRGEAARVSAVTDRVEVVEEQTEDRRPKPEADRGPTETGARDRQSVPRAAMAPPADTPRRDSSELEDGMGVSPMRYVTASTIGGRCRYCSSQLPNNRKLVFCPFCGHDLTTLQCPACSTELELGWKFCVTCGRTMAPPRTSGETAAPAG